jgi:very-short-patch-repair endonuclease
MNNINCEYCGEEVSNKKVLGAHYRKNKSCKEAFENTKLEKEKLKTLECMICGQKLRHINNTHLKKHNLTIEEYKEKYPNAKIFSDELLKEQNDSRQATLKKLYPNNEYATKGLEERWEKAGGKDAYYSQVSEKCSAAWTDEKKETQSEKIKTFYSELSEDVESHQEHKDTRLEKRKQTNLEKYGVEFTQQLETTKRKQKETLIDNFGSLENYYAYRTEKILTGRLENGEILQYLNPGKESQKLFRILNRIFKNKNLTLFNGSSYNREYRVKVSRHFRFLDFYIPELNAWIEFDEEHHKLQEESDLIRENQIFNVMSDIRLLRISSEEFNNDKKGTIRKAINFIYEM